MCSKLHPVAAGGPEGELFQAVSVFTCGVQAPLPPGSGLAPATSLQADPSPPFCNALAFDLIFLEECQILITSGLVCGLWPVAHGPWPGSAAAACAVEKEGGTEGSLYMAPGSA